MHRSAGMLCLAALACLQAGRAVAEEAIAKSSPKTSSKPPADSSAEGVHYYEENGVTYRQTVRTVQRPVAHTEWQQRVQTVYRPQLRTNYRDTVRTYSTPVTQYQWITRMHGRWNPFVTPYFTHHYVPVTRWEQRSEVVQVPVVSREWVPEKRTVSVPVTKYPMAEQQIISRAAVGSARPSSTGSRVAQRPLAGGAAIGGTALEGDPPRKGLHWRPPGTGTIYR